MSLIYKGLAIFPPLIHHTEQKLMCSVLPPLTATLRFYSENNQTASALRSKKAKSTRNTVQHFVDYHRVRTIAGNGGNGCISFLNDCKKEFAGPDGGDGGNGGHVIFYATKSVSGFNCVTSLLQSKHGENGQKKNCTGKNAKNFLVNVPIGTIVKDIDENVVADLSTEGIMFVAARGGAGGRGNKYFTTDIEQAPNIAELGAKGEENVYHIELRSMAHIGLIGFPNAGKSTLLRAVTRARPVVAPYPFTTLRPYLGTVLYDDHKQVTIADLPGLIEGSHKNKGLGIQFLQHAERCAGLLYMVDASLPEPWQYIEKLQYELSKFSPEMLNRPQLIVANKIDLEEAKNNIKLIEEHCNGLQVIPVSAKHGKNLKNLLNLIRQICDESDIAKTANLWH